MAATRGTEALRTAGIPFTVHTYAHRQKGARYAAEALAIPLDRFAKTLVAGVDGEPVLALLPGDRELSPKKLARAAGGKHAALVETRDAERLTGYQVGGIGPFGTRRRLPVYVETSLLDHEQMAVNAGGRGVIVELAPGDVVRLLEAVVADLAA